MVGLYRHTIGRLADRHDGESRQNLAQHAVVLWIEMLNYDKGQAGVAGQSGEETLEDLQCARGAPDADHRNARPGKAAGLKRLVVGGESSFGISLSGPKRPASALCHPSFHGVLIVPYFLFGR